MLRRNDTTGEVVLACPYCDAQERRGGEDELKITEDAVENEETELAGTIRTLHAMVQSNPSVVTGMKGFRDLDQLGVRTSGYERATDLATRFNEVACSRSTRRNLVLKPRFDR
jgi:hypothetical protein